MSDLTRKLAIFTCLLLTSFCFWKVGVGLTGGVDTEILPSAQAAISPSFSPPRVVTTPIQQMRPGMRIVGRNPLRMQTEPTIDPMPEGWRLVSVRMLKEDGTYFEAELLRPLSWIYRHHAQPGAVIQLNMPEMYVVGAAEVLSISDCPPIDPGDGPVVISTFKNVSHNVLNIYVEGETEPIGVTAGHPIWSEDRQAFIHSDQLQPGERMRSAVGKTVRITSIEIRAGPEPVYNLEIAGEHVYSVTGSGLLVHNTAECVRQRILANIAESKSARAASNYGTDFTSKSGTSLANLPDYANGIRGALSYSSQVAVVKSIRRQISKHGGNSIELGFLNNYDGIQEVLFRQHLGEQVLELNRLSLFHPDRLGANIANYPLLTNKSIAGVNWVDYMRSVAGRKLLGPKPTPAYIGQRFAAAHTLDSIAGGDFWRFIGWRDARINSSIGRQWKDRLHLIQPGNYHR
ncbi:hypothetical protein Mal35_20230 [Gimesia maris]|uniref:polymorphic toxin-type HINT domain-containing protein n=1 Tax=Gimesia maris TaxID=122 RepID=UPI00118BB3B3|nr:polymorphic toxin-type HINT domain-containing protein [Gimesia maris]QDT78574.1 hypothetical protein Mal35_20230 [Gimesia maris]